jgi:CO dehydrogenase maturation factor
VRQHPPDLEVNVMQKNVIACLGKGGAGKTAVSTMLGMSMIRQGLKPLFIDADPVGGIQKTLGVEDISSIADARNELVRIAKETGRGDGPGECREDMEFIIMQVLREFPSFGFIAIGQNHTAGCFCSINTLLRKTLSSVIDSYDAIIIDAEAGIEQVYRQVVERIGYAVLVTDISKRGVDTCASLKRAMSELDAMKGCAYGALFNKTEQVPAHHREFLSGEGIPVIGSVPLDPDVADFDSRGESLLSLPAGNSALRAVSDVLEGIRFQ